MTPDQIYARLREVAPLIVFSASNEPDPTFVWDGDGPDPAEDGFVAYDVTVSAETIINGEMKEGCSYLGGSYYELDEVVGDVGGYLPQMLEEAARELLSEIGAGHPQTEQLGGAIMFLKQELKDRWQEQQKERANET